MTTSIVPETFVKSITYSRADRDYTATLDGQYIGSFRSYHDAEVALDQVAYDLLTDERIVTADAEAERAAEQSTEAPPLVAPPAVPESDPVPPWPDISCPIVAPELLAEADTVLETPASYFADPTPLDIARTAATQIALAERARLLRRWAQDVGRPMHAFFILPGGEAAEQACLVVNGEPVHVSAALVAAALGAGR